MSSIQSKSTILKGKEKKLAHCQETKQSTESDSEFKINLINMLKDFMANVNNMHEHVGYFSREVETRSQNAREKNKIPVTEIQNAFNRLTDLTSRT